jgi:ABC-type phosphate/phosphonate transport system substrate-binding protein
MNWRRLGVIFVVTALLVCPAIAEVVSAEDKTEILRIGVSAQAVETDNTNDATAAIKAWATTIIKEQKLDYVPAEVRLYESAAEIALALQNNQIEAAALGVEESLRFGVKPDAVFVPATDQGAFTRYVILVHRDGGVASLNQLSPGKLRVYPGPRMSMAVPWVRSILGGPPEVQAQNWIAGREGKNPSKAILQVFFRQVPAVLVTRDAFAVSCELNPQLGKDLRVLAESPPFITSFIMMRHSWRDRFRKTLEDAFLDVHNTPGGRQVLTIFQSSRIELHPASILEPTQEVLRKHLSDYQAKPGAHP